MESDSFSRQSFHIVKLLGPSSHMPHLTFQQCQKTRPLSLGVCLFLPIFDAQPSMWYKIPPRPSAPSALSVPSLLSLLTALQF